MATSIRLRWSRRLSLRPNTVDALGLEARRGRTGSGPRSPTGSLGWRMRPAHGSPGVRQFLTNSVWLIPSLPRGVLTLLRSKSKCFLRSLIVPRMNLIHADHESHANGLCVWFTGLPAAGKTTIAEAL